MKTNKRNFFKIFVATFLVIVLLIFSAALLYERVGSKNVLINLSKRIVAESGAFISKSFLKDITTNNFPFGPSVDKKNIVKSEEIGEYFKNNFSKDSVKVIELINYHISPFAKNFDYENFSNPNLKQLENSYDFKKLILDAKKELDVFLIIQDWVKKSITHGIPQNVDYNFNSLDILDRARRGEKFFCSEYSTVFAQCMISLGYTARYVGLFKGHVVAEIWSNQFAKWITLDIDNNLHYERDGVPLNSLELHDAFENKSFSNIKVLKGPESNEIRDEYQKEYFLSFYHEFYVRMRNDWFSNRYPHWHYKGNSIMNGLEWSDKFTKNNFSISRATSNKKELYFPINITEVNVNTADYPKESMELILDTFTPNFSHFLIRVDDGQNFIFKDALYNWNIHKGLNFIEIKAVNTMDIAGPATKIKFILN